MDEKPKREKGNHQNPRGGPNNFFDLGHSNFLLDMSLEARETKASINYWDFIKIKCFWGAPGWLSQLSISLQLRS